ncbi:unnamed protein product [Prorocentrum cordatum]|uniref:Uncharacterized protein n=1 Tax=Prorocentrum cordatum TaxID=2364126 RepID=A0ABN9SEN8_9DINO|nr:unnamed protein product [Polarella glacialis]
MSPARVWTGVRVLLVGEWSGGWAATGRPETWPFAAFCWPGAGRQLPRRCRPGESVGTPLGLQVLFLKDSRKKKRYLAEQRGAPPTIMSQADFCEKLRRSDAFGHSG